MSNKKQVVQLRETSDYIEVACVNKPQRMCEFQTKNNQILRTVDAVIKDLETADQCKAE